MTYTDSRTEFSLLLGKSLMFATDPRNMTEKKWLMNNAVNQDNVLWRRPLYNATDGTQVEQALNGDVAVILYNRGTDADGTKTEGCKNVTIAWEDLGWRGDDGTYSIRDLWAHADVEPSDPTTGHTACVLPRDVEMLRIAKSL